MIFYNQTETSIKVVLSVFLQRKEYFNKLSNLERGGFMLRQHKKITAVVGLTISALMISSACYAQDDPNDGYVIQYDFETQETTYYGYDKENHEFYEVDDYVEPQEKVNLLEGKVNKVSKSYLIFTDQNNDDIKVKIKKDEQWHPGDEIKVFGLTKTKDGKVKLAKQYGYYKVE